MLLDLTNDRKEARAANTGFVSGGVTCKLEALCFVSASSTHRYSSSVLVDSFVLSKPALLRYFSVLAKIRILRNKHD